MPKWKYQPVVVSGRYGHGVMRPSYSSRNATGGPSNPYPRRGSGIDKYYKKKKKGAKRTRTRVRGPITGTTITKKSKSAIESIQHNDMSKDDVVFGTRKNKKFKTHQATTTTFVYGDHVTGAVSGVQGVNQMRDMLNVPAIVSETAYNAGAKTNDDVSSDFYPLGVFYGNMNSNDTGNVLLNSSTNSIGGTGLNAASRCQKAYIQSLKSEYTITSGTNVAQEMQVYFLLAREDMHAVNSPIGWWQDCVDLHGKGTTGLFGYNLLPQEFANAGFAGKCGATKDVYQYGNHFSEFREFKKKWEVIKVRSFILQGGASKRLRVKYKVNKWVDWADMYRRYTDGIKYMKGLTVVPLVICKPGLVYNKSVDATQENVYPAQVDYLLWCVNKLKVRYAANNQTRYVSYAGPGVQVNLDQELNEQIIDVTDLKAIPLDLQGN